MIDHGISFDPEYLFEDVQNTVYNIHQSGEIHRIIARDPGESMVVVGLVYRAPCRYIPRESTCLERVAQPIAMLWKETVHHHQLSLLVCVSCSQTYFAVQVRIKL